MVPIVLPFRCFCIFSLPAPDAAFQSYRLKVSDWHGKTDELTPTRMLQFLSENKDLRHECQVLAMEYRKILYSDAPLGWGNIPVDLRGDWSSFCVRKSSLGSAAGNGVFATKIIQPGTALCYGGSMVPPIDEYPPFDIDAYALEWGENCTVIGIPAKIVTLSDNRQILSGYLGPTVNEPRKCKYKRWQ